MPSFSVVQNFNIFEVVTVSCVQLRLIAPIFKQNILEYKKVLKFNKSDIRPLSNTSSAMASDGPENEIIIIKPSKKNIITGTTL